MTERTVTPPHFWALLDALPLALLYREKPTAGVYTNKAARELLQLPDDNTMVSLAELQKIPLFCPVQQQAFHLVQNPLLQALNGDELQQHVTLSDGSSLLLQSTLVTLPYTLHQNLLISFQPQEISNKSTSNDNAEVAEALAFDKLMSLISTQLINVQDSKLDQHIETALAAIGEFCHSDRSYVFLFNHSIDEMSNTHEWVRQGISAHKEQLQQIPEAALPYFYRHMKQDRVFAVSNVAELPAEAAAEKQEFEAEDIQSVLCCAMLAEDKLLGFVGCDMVSRQRNWTDNDLRRLKLVGEMLANTLQNVSYRRSLQQMQQQLLQANQELEKQASQDGLTAIANRRQFDRCLQTELQRCARNKLPLGLILLDIDRFKLYNDHYGHQAGDDVLKQVAEMLHQQTKRSGELAARYGGEEFALILPGSDIQACEKLATQIQHGPAVSQYALHGKAIGNQGE